MKLDQYEKEMLGGRHGPGKRRCMELLVKFGEAMGADRMVPIRSAHTMPKEPLELLQDLTEGVDRLGAFTTTHPTMSAFSLRNWEQMGISPDFAARELSVHDRRQQIYRRAGFYETYTCLPILAGNLARPGERVSWIGSSLQLLTNSILGARTNRDGTVVNLASAITGRTPDYGFHKDENRKAQVQVDLKALDVERMSTTDLGAISYWLGAKAGSRNVVFSHVPDLNLDRLRYLLPPLSVTGSVGICHIVGVTPEASSLEQALGNQLPEEMITVGRDQIEEARSLYARGNREVELTIFGCPHCTITELGLIARLVTGRRLAPGKRLWIGTGHQTYGLAVQMGFANTIEEAGGVFASACMSAIPEPPIPASVKVAATNSFKAAHYISRLSKGSVAMWVADLEECLEAVLD
jgi:predicted aconitase